jgi:hypothetical protein
MSRLSTFFGRKPGKYKYPVYRADDRPQRFSFKMLEEMDADQLWEDIKRFCSGD